MAEPRDRRFKWPVRYVALAFLLPPGGKETEPFLWLMGWPEQTTWIRVPDRFRDMDARTCVEKTLEYYMCRNTTSRAFPVLEEGWEVCRVTHPPAAFFEPPSNDALFEQCSV